jgi:hypothetical protein
MCARRRRGQPRRLPGRTALDLRAAASGSSRRRGSPGVASPTGNTP